MSYWIEVVLDWDTNMEPIYLFVIDLDIPLIQVILCMLGSSVLQDVELQELLEIHSLYEYKLLSSCDLRSEDT
tara:strand:+ start:178 stop:396 length:219 start_codon:yes stop_codon:yes gene_type:complete